MADNRTLVQDFASTPITGQTITPNGYMVVPARIARTGVQDYFAIEFDGLFEDKEPMDVVRLYRPPEEVFAADALASFNRLPVTDNHPYEDVVASNWNDHAVGSTEGEARQDGEFVAHTLVINDAGAVNDIQRGKRELSCGWSFLAEVASGETPDGESYDLIARDIRGNHIAIVEQGRCGPGCRTSDSAKSPRLHARLKDSCKCAPAPADKPKEPEMTTRTVTVDGLQVEATEASAAALEKVIGERNAAKDALTAEKTARAADAAEHQKALGGKDAEIADLKGKELTAADIDKLAQERAQLVADAKPFLAKDFDATGKSADEIRAAAVANTLGAEAVKDKSPEYISGSYGHMVATGAKQSSNDTFVPSGASGVQSDPNDNGQTAYDARTANAWKRPTVN